MAKIDWIEFGEKARGVAGDIYISQQEIKVMRQKQKQKEEEFKLTKAQTLSSMKSQALKDAIEIDKARDPEKYAKPERVEEKGRAEVLAKLDVIYSKDPATWTPAEKSYVQNMAPYITRRKTDVTGMPSGGGKGGATASQWVGALQKNQDDRVGVINKLRGEIDPNSELQIAVDYMGEFDKVKTVEELGELHKQALSKLNAMAAEGKIEIPLVNSTISSLNFYKELSEDRIWYQQQAGRPTTTQRPQTKTEIPIWGFGDAPPEDVQMMDDIIKEFKKGIK